MNILIFSANYSSIYIGGHISSMLTIGNELIKNKFNVIICLPETLGKNSGVKEVGEFFPIENIIWIPKSKYFSDLINYKKYIYSIIKNYKIDIIHSFDLPSHIIARFCIEKFKYRVKALSNICGGTIKYKYPYVSPIIVFSEELSDQIQKMYNYDAPEVILERSRMTPSFYLSGQVEGELNLNLKKKIGNKKVIFMVTRMSFVKIIAIDLALDSIKKLAQKREDFLFILIGRINRKTIYKYVKKKVDLINNKSGRQVVLFDNNLSKMTRKIFSISDIVMGVGKVCFEGMLNKKPVIVLGGNGCSGVVDIESQEKFQQMVYTNFSSRDVNDTSKQIEKIIFNIELLLNNKRTRERLGLNNFEWVNNNLDIKQGIDIYISTYNRIQKMEYQKLLPVRFAYYGILIMLLGRVKGLIRELYLNIKFW
tara:strand:+ start:684 stop:1952 length:1269 start_codon:yes stop_codon:yes gene_type:complete